VVVLFAKSFRPHPSQRDAYGTALPPDKSGTGSAGEGSPHAQATAVASAVASSPSRGIPKGFGKRGSND